MKHHEIKSEIERLSNAYRRHRYSLVGKVKRIQQNKELMKLFASLHQLLQEPLFFEIFLNEGFKKIKDAGDGNTWNFASPIVPLLDAMTAILGFPYKSEDTKIMENFSRLSQFSCPEKVWCGADFGLDYYLSDRLVTDSQDELFLGTFSVDLRKKNEIQQFEGTIKQLELNTSSRATVLFTVYDGTFTEPLFFIKNKDRIEVIVATNSWGTTSHIHRVTNQFIKKYKINCTASSNVKVNHNGDCTLHSELNINTILYEALCCRSVYKAVDKLRQNKLSLNDFRVTLDDVSPSSTSRDKPDPSTLARLLIRAANNFVKLGSSGWIDFCKAKEIHPLLCIKTVSTAWETVEYPQLSQGGHIESKLEALISQEEISNVPCIAQNYIEKLNSCGELGTKILEQILRLQAHQNSMNPYWINCKEKAEAIIEAVDNAEFEGEESLALAVNHPESSIYLALNIHRISALSFLGVFGWNQSKSLQRVHEVVSAQPSI
ncbi:hypothetical protein Lnau_2001 [Legionella nautarum]|uniref:Uncharacterized protein n=1 Tax=Legionella nautarum TaxID=45070 RepID=A0A0W0WS16_9GAMM|nr:hypothetical protein [Legionella nautarum]KTD35111.1 hypothetical protein Lnau_2001 [Legionella nautarum]